MNGQNLPPSSSSKRAQTKVNIIVTCLHAFSRVGCYFTVLCKKNANEFRRISAIVQPKNRRNFGRNFVISQSKFCRIFGELRENSSTSRKFADPRAKFRSDFVCTEAKFRIADRKFEILKRNFARLEGPRVTVFRIHNGSCLQARHHVSTRSHSTRSDLEK